MSHEKAKQKHTLKPTLSLMDATAISVGAIIGAGIFVVTGIAAGLAGSALIISILLAAIIVLFTALSFVELTAWQPKEGSIYEYSYQLISPFAGFLTGWMWIIANTFAGAAVALGFASYLQAAFPILEINWTAAILCIAFTALNFFGIRQSALLNNFLVAAKLLVLAFFVILGLAYVKPANFADFAPFNVNVVYGACYIFFAYGGFARAAVVAEEVKDAKRNVPRAILLSLVISTIIYLLVGIVAVGLIGAGELAKSNSPLTEAINITNNNFAFYLVSAGGLLATASVLLTAILGVSRMMYAMAERKDLPKAFSKVHEKHNTPYYAIWTVGVMTLIFVLFINLKRVVVISTFALLFYYLLANISAFKLKIQKRVFPKFIPVLGTITCLVLLTFIFFTLTDAWIMGIACLALGVICYVVKQSNQTKIR